MGKLADLFDRDMAIRGLAEGTRKEYVSRVRNFVEFFGRSPSQATLDDVTRYQDHLIRERRVSWSYAKVIAAALKFFFGTTLKKDWNLEDIPYPRRTGRRLPVILSQEEVIRFFAAISNVKHRIILTTIYATGVRVSEALRLKVTDIDSSRMVVRIEQGKGRKDRYVMLSPILLSILREYWKIARPKIWLFQHHTLEKPLTTSTIREVVRKARKSSGLRKTVRSHDLRHAFATHLMEKGVNIRIIQTLLGHRSLRSTEIYTHVSKTYLQDTKSPLDDLSGLVPPVPPKKSEEPKK
jgi:integrase/recombinase XerD